MGSDKDIVYELLQTPFSRRTDEEKRDIIQAGRPTVVIPLSGSKIETSGRHVSVMFKSSWFSGFKWLCSSPALQKLFCWPCLLFSHKQWVWNKTGFVDVLNIARGLHKHNNSGEHIKCQLMLKNFEKDQLTIAGALNENARLIKLQFNENVRLNRIFLTMVIDAALYCGKQKMKFCDHDNDEDFFTELLELQISRSSLEIRNHCDKMKTVFGADSTTTQNEVLTCIYGYMKNYIIKDINEALFFSIQIDDATDITLSSQCSLIVRFVNSEGLIVERFLGFYDVSADRTSDAVYDMLDKILNQFDCENKLIGQCYDGASVMSDHLNGLQEKIKASAPKAIFVHSLAHRLDFVLQDSLKTITDCKIFFASLTEMSSCCRYLANRSATLASTSTNHIPTVEARWCFNSKLVYTIVQDWVKLKELFGFHVTCQHSDQKSVQLARGFLNDMNDFDFTFLVVAFNDIFASIDILYNTLQENSLHVNVCFHQLMQTREILNEKRKDDFFVTIFNRASKMTELNVTEDIKYFDVSTKYKVLYFEILDHILMEVDVRFQDCEKLQFVCLADTMKFEKYNSNFPCEVMESMQEFYKDIFVKDALRLKNELCLLYANESYRNIPLQELLKKLNKDKDIFTGVYKLFCIIATLPSTSLSTQRKLTCLKRLKEHSRNAVPQELSLAVISIEKELLSELKKNPLFYEDIKDKYASLEGRRIDLIYKI